MGGGDDKIWLLHGFFSSLLRQLAFSRMRYDSAWIKSAQLGQYVPAFAFRLDRITWEKARKAVSQ